jgi:Holliday junction resolvase-like predicted endonuclease
MKRQKGPKLSGIQVGIAGEYFVAAELSRRGYIASLTLRNTPGIDILASNKDATKSVGIQVKTTRGANPAWMMSNKAERKTAKNRFYVLVCLTTNSTPTYYVVPHNVVAEFVAKSHKHWLKRRGREGRAHRDSSLRKFRDREIQFKDAWYRLGLD